MDIVWGDLQQSTILVITLLLVGACEFSRLVSRDDKVVRKEDLVPAYRRFERREGEDGDRRHGQAEVFQGVDLRMTTRRSATVLRR